MPRACTTIVCTASMSGIARLRSLSWRGSRTLNAKFTELLGGGFLGSGIAGGPRLVRQGCENEAMFLGVYGGVN